MKCNSLQGCLHLDTYLRSTQYTNDCLFPTLCHLDNLSSHYFHHGLPLHLNLYSSRHHIPQCIFLKVIGVHFLHQYSSHSQNKMEMLKTMLLYIFLQDRPHNLTKQSLMFYRVHMLRSVSYSSKYQPDNMYIRNREYFSKLHYS